VTANDVTIDLGGFTITAANAGGGAISDGIRGPSQRAITVRNGYILGPGFGVDLGNTDGAVVEDMDVSGTTGAIAVLRGQVERNHAHDNNGDGIHGSEAIAAIDNISVNNKHIGLVAGPGSRIEGNLVGGNGFGIFNIGDDLGSVFIGNSILRDNVAFRNTQFDFAVNCPALLERNVEASPTPNFSTSGACTGSPNQPNLTLPTSTSARGAIRVSQSRGAHQ
jgi:hypothetical protein